MRLEDALYQIRNDFGRPKMYFVMSRGVTREWVHAVMFLGDLLVFVNRRTMEDAYGTDLKDLWKSNPELFDTPVLEDDEEKFYKASKGTFVRSLFVEPTPPPF